MCGIYMPKASKIPNQFQNTTKISQNTKNELLLMLSSASALHIWSSVHGFGPWESSMRGKRAKKNWGWLLGRKILYQEWLINTSKSSSAHIYSLSLHARLLDDFNKYHSICLHTLCVIFSFVFKIGRRERERKRENMRARAGKEVLFLFLFFIFWY